MRAIIVRMQQLVVFKTSLSINIELTHLGIP